MAVKQSGHYCWGCSRHQANEKFNGKGHSRHICKGCMRKGYRLVPEDTPAETNGVQYYKKRIGNNMILFAESSFLFLFVYEGRYYAANLEKDERVFQFQKNSEPPFVRTSEFTDSWNFQEALGEKYSASLDNGHSMDFEEYLACFEGTRASSQALPKKQRVFLDMVLAIERGASNQMWWETT